MVSVISEMTATSFGVECSRYSRTQGSRAAVTLDSTTQPRLGLAVTDLVSPEFLALDFFENRQGRNSAKRLPAEALRGGTRSVIRIQEP